MSLRTSTKRKFHDPVEDVANKRTAATPATSPVSYPFLSEREVMECKEGETESQDLAIQAAMGYILHCRVPGLVFEKTKKSFKFRDDVFPAGAVPGAAPHTSRHHIFTLNSVCEFDGNPCLAVMELNSSTFGISVCIFAHKDPEDYDDEDDYWDDDDFQSMDWEDLQGLSIDRDHYVMAHTEEIVGWIGMEMFGRMFGRLNK